MSEKEDAVDIANIVTVIDRLRRQGRDDSTCEVKECTHSLSNDIWETVSAFANTEGGMIILGLSEKNGFAPVDDFDLYKVRDQFIDGIGDMGKEGRLTNPPHYSMSVVEYEKSSLLAIAVDELDLAGKPCFITARGKQGGSYKRVDDADIRLSANEVYSLDNICVYTDADCDPVLRASVDDLDEVIYTEVFNKARQVMPRALRNAESTVVRLQRLNFIDKNADVTKAGLLIAGFYPQQFFPKLHVDVAVHVGREKSASSDIRFLDRVICEGTIGEMLEGAVSAVAKNLKRSSAVRGIGRSDELEIPEEVLREAVANALIHRDYDSRFDGESISVNVFEDRIEVVSPGGLWGKSRHDLTDGRSCCRNATLMKLALLSNSPNHVGSPAEGNGTGILLMINEMLKRNLKRPEFYPGIDHFKVVLYRPNHAGMKSPRRDIGEAKVVSLLLEYGELSVHELEEKSGLSVNQVRSRIRKLLDEKVIEATAPPTSRNRKYRIRKA